MSATINFFTPFLYKDILRKNGIKSIVYGYATLKRGLLRLVKSYEHLNIITKLLQILALFAYTRISLKSIEH